jgi:hypothetical protein
VSSTRSEEWVLRRQDKGPGRLQKVSAQGEELHAGVEVFTGDDQRIDAHNEIKLILSHDRFNEAVDDLDVREIAAPSPRAFNERLTRLKRHDLEASLTEVAGKVSGTTSDLKNTRTRWQLQRSNQRAPKWGDVVPKLFQNGALHQLRTQGADILNILQERLKTSGFRCRPMRYLGLEAILLNNVSNITMISGVLFKNFGEIHARNYRGSLYFSKGEIFP